MSFKTRNKKEGFAMLFAVLMSAVLISIGMSIFNLSLKGLILSTSERDSQIAYYAGTSAVECIRYWSSKGNFPNVEYDDDTDSYYWINANNVSIRCNGNANNITLSWSGNCKDNPSNLNGSCYYSSSSFLNFSNPNLLDPLAPFADLSVRIYFTDHKALVFDSNGYNTNVIGKRILRNVYRQN